jgi:hypothetical protein
MTETTPRLIVGWEIEKTKFDTYMKNNMESRKKCICIPKGWGNNWCGPKCWGDNWKHDFVVRFFEYNGSGCYYLDFPCKYLYVSLTEEDCITGPELVALLTNADLIAKAKTFAISMGAEDKDITISSVDDGYN